MHKYIVSYYGVANLISPIIAHELEKSEAQRINNFANKTENSDNALRIQFHANGIKLSRGTIITG